MVVRFDAGLTDKIHIDGTPVPIAPESVQIDPSPLGKIVTTVSDRNLGFTLLQPGHPERSRSLSFAVPFGNISDDTGAARQFFEYVTARQQHTLCLWKSETLVWTASDAMTTLCLPHGRLDAPVALSASLTDFDIQIWVDGSEKTILRKTLAELSGTPGVDEFWIADAVDTTGYVPIKTRPLTLGVEVVLAYFPLYTVLLTNEQLGFRNAIVESRTLNFIEK